MNKKELTALTDRLQKIDELFKNIDEELEKSTAKKPIILPNDNNMLHYECPNCKSRIWSNFREKYCRSCGQKLDWSNENEE